MKLYFKFFGIHLKSAMQYKISFLMTSIGQFLVSFNVFLGMYFMYVRFHEVKGYHFSEVLLCFATVLFSYTLAEMFMRGFDTFAQSIGNGEFDRILLRPRSIILQVISSKIEFTRIGRMLQAIVMFVYGILTSEIGWTKDKILTLLLMVIGGTVVFSCLFIIYASICFFTLEGLEFMNILTDGAKEFGKYPIDIYGKGVLKFCIYIVPYALFQYYPFLYLTGRSEQKLYMLLPIAACLFLIPSGWLWKFGVKHYKSTGS
ncbi:MAG: ABC-2 family transporter protein [Mobilitalea sp.]